ncbi:hypothetical protein Hanom_Chr10g00922111 [Helianthus anomalus]
MLMTDKYNCNEISNNILGIAFINGSIRPPSKKIPFLPVCKSALQRSIRRKRILHFSCRIRRQLIFIFIILNNNNNFITNHYISIFTQMPIRNNR